jgi:hypothetical protein
MEYLVVRCFIKLQLSAFSKVELNTLKSRLAIVIKNELFFHFFKLLLVIGRKLSIILIDGQPAELASIRQEIQNAVP